MKLSTPVYRLKRKARLLAREANVPHHEALDRVALQEGYRNWGLLAAKLSTAAPAKTLFDRLKPGDLLLIGARPGHGKTLLSLELAMEAIKAGNRAAFFSLEYTERDIVDRFRALGVDPTQMGDRFGFDCFDGICADYMMHALASAPRGTLVVVDYLQLLDQKRQNAELSAQIRALKAFALARGMIIVFLSQVDRSYDPARKTFPDTNDVRLPNALDLHLFNKTCFLHDGEARFLAAG